MRKVELLNLRKYDIRFRERKIAVHTAKSHKTRIINIDLKITILLYFYCRKLKDNELLFKLSSTYVSCEFHKLMKHSNLKKITLHDIRHIYASFLLSKLQNSANSILFVSKQLRTFFCCWNTTNLFTHYKFWQEEHYKVYESYIKTKKLSFLFS